MVYLSSGIPLTNKRSKRPPHGKRGRHAPKTTLAVKESSSRFRFQYAVFEKENLRDRPGLGGGGVTTEWHGGVLEGMGITSQFAGGY